MLSRRETILSGALTLMFGGCACAQSAAPEQHDFGCTLDVRRAEPLIAAATEPQIFDSSSERLLASSGNRDLDYALAQTLSHLTNVFGVLPGFCFFDDQDNPNAYATPATRMRRADGTVLFGRRYLAKRMSEAAENPDAVIAAICAHEFGHIVQYKYGLLRLLNDGQTSVKRSELNADFFAGYFAGARKLQKAEFPAAVFATNRYATGDFSQSRSHHGTPNERAAAVIRGFETSYRERRSFQDAIQTGLNYASRL